MDEKRIGVVVSHNDLGVSGYVSSDPNFTGNDDGALSAPLVFDEQKIHASGDPNIHFGTDRILYK